MRIHRVASTTYNSTEKLENEIQKVLSGSMTALWMPLKQWLLLDQAQLDQLKSVDKICEVTDISQFLEFVRQVNDGVVRSTLLTTINRWVIVGSQYPVKDIRDLCGRFPNIDFLIRPNSRKELKNIGRHIPNLLVENVYFEFLPWCQQFAARPTVTDIRHFLGRAGYHNPYFKVKLYPGLESLDDRVSETLDLEPAPEVKICRQIFNSKPKISVVIPTYNNYDFVYKVIVNLVKQSLAPADYEIILVDDGSSDGTFEAIQNYISSQDDKINFTYLYLARHEARRSGDNLYRAGIARNAGACHARGRWIQFLDSDILVRPQFLERVLKALQVSDVVQCQRFHIDSDTSQKVTRYHEVDQNHQIFIEDENYWAPFFLTDSWRSLAHYWKYTCTYALALKREDFFKCGRFKRNFTTYGFEDVDLGYELARQKKTFNLLKERTLHLTPERSRSEYAHSRFFRYRLLSRSAKTFFRQHLDLEIYDLLKIYMSEGSVWGRVRTLLRS